MKKNILLFLFINLNILISQPLKVGGDSHFLTDSEGKPFFWLADTGWELFHRLNRDECKYYFQKRKEQGFNIIQAVVLYELNSFESPNAYGDFPLIDGDISKINITPGSGIKSPFEYDYWDHVRFIVKSAAEKDLIIGLLPCWGEYVTPRFRERTIKTVSEGYEYGFFIGDWLKDFNDHIVWILGGDRLPDEKPKGIDIWRSMAEGITDAVNNEKEHNGKADYEKTFMTYHCYASSSNWFDNDKWIDMHTWGSYHEKKNNERAYLIAWNEWNNKNVKPFVNSEPAYENLPINYDWENVSYGRFNAFDVRQIAYWSVFAGAAGHTYGAHEVWIMHKHENQFLPLTSKLENEWKDALEYEGAYQMKHLKNLFLSYPFFNRKPDLEVIANNPNDPPGKIVATSGEDHLFVYTPTGKEIHIDKTKIGVKNFKAKWYDTETGKFSETIFSSNEDILIFDPPGNEEIGNDWVLVLDKK